MTRRERERVKWKMDGKSYLDYQKKEAKMPEHLEGETAESFQKEWQEANDSVDHLWDPASYEDARNPEDLDEKETQKRIEAVENRLKEAQEKGEKILEIPLQITVKIPEKLLVSDRPCMWGMTAVELFSAPNRQKILSELYGKILEMHPEIVEAGKQRVKNINELRSMLEGIFVGEVKKTPLFNEDRAMELVRQNREITQRFGLQDSETEHLIAKFKDVGVELESGRQE